MKRKYCNGENNMTKKSFWEIYHIVMSIMCGALVSFSKVVLFSDVYNNVWSLYHPVFKQHRNESVLNAISRVNIEWPVMIYLIFSICCILFYIISKEYHNFSFILCLYSGLLSQTLFIGWDVLLRYWFYDITIDLLNSSFMIILLIEFVFLIYYFIKCIVLHISCYLKKESSRVNVKKRFLQSVIVLVVLFFVHSAYYYWDSYNRNCQHTLNDLGDGTFVIE